MTGSSTRMLPLLLLFLFVSSNQSTPTQRTTTRPCKLSEFTKLVNLIGEDVKNCSENCSSVQDTDIRCTCLNLTMTTECAFREYFENGLSNLTTRFMGDTKMYIHTVKKILLHLIANCTEINFCTLKVDFTALVSPKSFHEKLHSAIQQMKSSAAHL